jgi:hypothetical protein
VPEGLDVLLVEQEVVGTDQAALASVVAADVELMALREQEAELNRCGHEGVGGRATPACCPGGRWLPCPQLPCPQLPWQRLHWRLRFGRGIWLHAGHP